MQAAMDALFAVCGISKLMHHSHHTDGNLIVKVGSRLELPD